MPSGGNGDSGGGLGIAALADLAPEVDVHLAAFRDVAVATVEPRLAELCRLRMAMLHGSAADPSDGSPLTAAEVAALPDWPTSERFDERDRACLAMAEQFVIDVSTTTDDQVAAVLDHLGPAGLYGFVHALLAIDETQRLAVALGRLFDDDAAPAAPEVP